jgi:hypothetical protein
MGFVNVAMSLTEFFTEEKLRLIPAHGDGASR